MPSDLTEALLSWNSDKNAAMERILPEVYSELRIIAASLMRREREGHTLQATALVHEAYVRLVRQDSVAWQDRAHFFGVAAHIMRQILVQHARGRQAQKRNGGVQQVLSGQEAVATSDTELILQLNEALERLAEWDSRKLQVLELHYFAGLKAEEISEALSLTLATVRRDLTVGRTWLKRRLT